MTPPQNRYQNTNARPIEIVKLPQTNDRGVRIFVLN